MRRARVTGMEWGGSKNREGLVGGEALDRLGAPVLE